jgi:hypothetical protein
MEKRLCRLGGNDWLALDPPPESSDLEPELPYLRSRTHHVLGSPPESVSSHQRYLSWMS